ncbi:hypothetical protein ASG17_06730 [Brevundimonas sp. Leaf363]|uniref:hypothetical protein n=1 Tax=Brevundimonas sp. Leaf363 TaxID=1736353 RepID=UPI0006FA8A92|nr:hypothetical protein [Brevundimonas sp. Leaf363]KQS55752.1 hypothetical protein ASG17_06730 [Brevundimonas sp. Leaf363]RYG07844.1 MAG: hypothetical protein EON96_20900 [Caulobacteraceae bacterium]
MTLQAIAETLAAQLDAAEQALDRAIIETAALNALAPQARMDAGVPAALGQSVFEEAAAALAAATEARTRLARAHSAITAVAHDLGIGALAIGPVDKPDDDPPHGREAQAKRSTTFAL